MHPIIISFKLFSRELTIGTYGLLMVTAIFTAIFLAWFRGKRTGQDGSEIFDALILIACGGVAGALVTGFLIFLPERISYGFFTYPPVLVSWGGILGGALVLFILKKRWDIDLPFYADLLAPSYLIGIAIGRIGCHFAGCCFGVHSDGPLALHFTNSLAPASSAFQPLVPTQLISAAVLITGGILAIMIAPTFKVKGNLLFVSLIFYGAFRFTIEFWRADTRAFIGPFSDGQLFSMAAAAAGIIGILINKRLRASQ